MTAGRCSCGNGAVHVVARRATFDGIGVELHSDGAVTGRLGSGIDGVPVARPRTATSRDLALRAGWLFVGECEVHNYTDLGALYEACRFVAARNGLPGDVRKRFHAERALVPAWTATATDRDGTPTERQWRLPRVLGRNLGVIDHVNHGARGRYEVVTIDPQDRETCHATGFSFRTLAELSAHLRASVAS